MTDDITLQPQLVDAAVPRGYWPNAAGSLVPTSKIKPIDKMRHHLVCDIAAKAKALNKALADFKAATMTEIEQFVTTSAEAYDKPLRGSVGKGNITLTSFDGRYKVERQVADRMVFDERLQVAKGLIDECLHRWGKGANHNIQALVKHAFRVDKAGQVSVGNVLGLRQVQIDDEQWRQAMEAIADSMQSVASVQYVRVYERTPSGAYVAIPLNTAVI